MSHPSHAIAFYAGSGENGFLGFDYASREPSSFTDSIRLTQNGWEGKGRNPDLIWLIPGWEMAKVLTPSVSQLLHRIGKTNHVRLRTWVWPFNTMIQNTYPKVFEKDGQSDGTRIATNIE